MRWNLGKITYEFRTKKCSCRAALCVEACGQGVLDFLEKSRKMRVINLKECIICRQCEEVCPKGAISIRGALTLRDIRMHPR